VKSFDKMNFLKGSGCYENSCQPKASENLKDRGESAEKFSFAPMMFWRIGTKFIERFESDGIAICVLGIK
jgi:hypothetical protein